MLYHSPTLTYVEYVGVVIITHMCNTNNSYTHAPRSLQILLTRRPEAVAPEHSEGATKGLRVYKICRLRGACV